MKFKTVREGQQAVVYNHLGEGRLLVGPQRVFLCCERLQKLASYTASPYQYLIIEDISGLVKHKPGPCQMFCNPLELKSIRLATAMKIDANHMIVVYRCLPDDTVQRRIVQGPTVFVPDAEEWLHEFTWHAEDKETQGRMIPGGSQFKMLAAIPDQFYYNVREVRTNDDTMLVVKLMIFYEIKDVITMLEATHDPIADLINAVCADIISFAGKLSYEDFLVHTSSLSSLEKYPQLLQRAERIGYIINKVVYRGYHASDQLQMMQDTSIHSRTQMRLNAELEEQKQKLTEFKLQKEEDRTKLRQLMESSKADHRHKLEAMKLAHTVEMHKHENETALFIDNLRTTTQLDVDREKKQHQVEKLEQLSQIGVNPTEYLINQQPPTADEEFRIVPTAGNTRITNI